MAKTRVEVDLIINGQQSVKQVEQSTTTWKEELSQIKKMLSSGDIDNAQFQKLTLRAGELQDKISGVNRTITNLASNTRGLDSLLGASQAIIGGFSAAKGVMAIFGSNTDEVSKTLIKLQGAMSALNGIQAISNSLSKESSIVTNLAAVSWGKLNDAMKAGIIGAVLTVIALVVDQMTKWTKATDSQKTAQDELNDSLAITDSYLQSSADNSNFYTKLKLQNAKAEGQSVRELNKILEDADKKETERLYNAYLAKQKITDEYFQKQLDAQYNYNNKSNSDNKKALDEANNNLKQANSESTKANDEYNKQLDANITNKNERIHAEAEDDKKNAIEAKKKQKELLDQKFKDEMDAYKRKRDLALEDAQLERDLIASLENEGKGEEERRRKQEEFSKAYRLGLTIKQYQKQKEINAQELKDTKAFNDEKAKAEFDLLNAKRAALETGFNIAQQFAGKNKTLSDVLFAVQKGVAIAQIIVDTQKEISGYASNPTWSLMPDGGAAIKTAAITAAKVRAATSIATIAATTVGKFMNGGSAASVSGGGGGSTSTGVGSMASAPNTSRFVPTTTSGGQSSQRVYVLEKDITDSQGRVAKIRHNATLI